MNTIRITPILFLLTACTSTPPQVARETTFTPVKYACGGGAEVTAVYRGDTATVSLPDGRLLTLPHVVSGSGSRYSRDSTTWWINGDSGFVMRGDSVTIKDCGARP